MTLAMGVSTLERTELLGRLAGHPGPVLVTAPPGFGKSTLLDQWVDRNGQRVTRIQIDQTHDSPTRLLDSIAEGLSLSSALSRDADLDAGVALLQKHIVSPTTLILDDFQTIHDPTCHALMNQLANEGPTPLRLVISSRGTPPLELARLRATGTLLEIGTSDLAFSREETGLFLAAHGVLLWQETIDALFEQTEGWPVGLGIAARVIAGADDQETAAARFRPDHREVSDFLEEEILQRLGERERDFVVRTSILDRFTSSLCDAVTAGTDSSTVMLGLERQHSLLVPLDDHREWYRYPRLLSAMLRHQNGFQPGEEQALHRVAAEWFESHGELEPAVRHFIDAGLIETAADTLADGYLATVESGGVLDLQSCLERFPRQVVTSEPRLSVIEAWVMSILQRPADAAAALENAHKSYQSGPLPDGTNSVEATEALIEASFPAGDVGRMVSASQRVYELEGGAGSRLIHLAHVLHGVNLYFAGDPERAAPLLERAAALSRVSERWANESGAACLRSWIALDSDESEVAMEWATRAVTVAEAAGMTRAPYGGYATATMAAALTAQGRGGEALRLIEPALEKMRAGVEPLILAQVLLALSGILLGQGDLDAASAAHAEAEMILSGFTDPGMLWDRSERLASELRIAGGTELTTREIEILRLLERDLTKRQIAETLFVSYNTVHTHVKSIYKKIGGHTRSEVLMKASQIGLLETLRDIVIDH